MRRALLLSAVLSTLCCGGDAATFADDRAPAGGKADDVGEGRRWSVLLTAPHCDVCSSADKTFLLENSAIVAKILALIESAETSIDVAQFTFSNRDIEAALIAANEDGKTVRIAMNAAQAMGDTVATRLAAAGIDVKFIEGKDAGSFVGLQHAKFMVVDDAKLLMGSNNWSSTGLSINNENTVVLESTQGDPLVAAFACYFDAMVENRIGDGPACGTDEVAFTPSSGPTKVIRDEVRAATRSVDVLMHHLVFDDSLKELTKAARKVGVTVRVIVNAADRGETQGSRWDEFRAAGGQVRYKQTNADLFQIMHHKLVVVDGDTLVLGSGNWSGSAFFNNWEFYVRNRDAEVVQPFQDAFDHLWELSLTAESLDAGRNAAEQDTAGSEVFFGNLHAHFEAHAGERLLDDGKNERAIDGERRDVSDEFDHGDSARFAFEYARDEARMDFLALSPHTTDAREDDPPDLPNMSPAGFAALQASATAVNEQSEGMFVALAGMEWSTNSTGNHVGVLGSEDLCEVERGAFDVFWSDWLPSQTDPVVILNHPRTFRHAEDALEGAWDRIFGVNLLEIPKAGERNKKFNDFGLDDFEPLRSVHASWIAGEVEPDPAVVSETLEAIRVAADPYARLMEVTVGRGTELDSDTPINPSLTELDDGTVERFTKVHSDWDDYLLHGFRLAPAANHDNHFGNWGTGHTSRTAIIAPVLAEGALLDAMRRRSVYASEDENLVLRLYADGRVRAGGELRTVSREATLDLFVDDPDFAETYAVTVFVGTVGADTVEAVSTHELAGGRWHHLPVQLQGGAEHFAYVEVHEPGPDRMAWSAPVWIQSLTSG